MKNTSLLGIAVAVVLLCSPAFAADAAKPEPGAGKGKHGHWIEMLLNGELAQKIDAHIQKIKERLAKHPNAPESVTTATQKLETDLTDKKQDLGKLAEAVKAMRAARQEMKADRQQIRADRQAMREALQGARGRNHGLKRGGGDAGKNANKVDA